MRALVAVLCFSFLVAVLPVMAQDASQRSPDSTADPQFGEQRNKQSPDEVKMARDMARARNKERQQQLQRDTEKLLKLATELKQYVDKTNENILSLDVLKKTDEIEKLAKSVHDKMKAGGYQGVAE